MNLINKRKQLPITLTIAGTDSGGGAGIQADLKTFAALNVHACSVITCMTAQNPATVLDIMASTPQFLQNQLKAVFSELPPVAIKTGMLYNASLIEVVVDYLQGKHKKLVIDPVMISTSGSVLLQKDAISVLKTKLFPLATLITPNLDELSYLLEHPIKTRQELRQASREFFAKYHCPVLVKGGHLHDDDLAQDILWDGTQEWTYCNQYIHDVSTHGTGCTLSAAITAYLALGEPLNIAVEKAKNYIHHAIAGSVRIANHYALDWFHTR